MLTNVFNKYENFINIFLSDLLAGLDKYIRINYYIIK